MNLGVCFFGQSVLMMSPSPPKSSGIHQPQISTVPIPMTTNPESDPEGKHSTHPNMHVTIPEKELLISNSAYRCSNIGSEKHIVREMCVFLVDSLKFEYVLRHVSLFNAKLAYGMNIFRLICRTPNSVTLTLCVDESY